MTDVWATETMFKPCPFCGVRPLLIRHTPLFTKRWWEIKCGNPNCHVQAGTRNNVWAKHDMKQMEELWNLRA